MFAWLHRFNSTPPAPQTSLSEIEEILRHEGRGIYKRIDEHRELLQLLQHCAPNLLTHHNWVIGWLRSQDSFLCRVANTLADSPAGFDGLGLAPRPWPGPPSPDYHHRTILVDPPPHLRRPVLEPSEPTISCPHGDRASLDPHPKPRREEL